MYAEVKVKKRAGMKSGTLKRWLSVAVICTFLPNGMSWGALQPPLNQASNPVYGTTGGVVPPAVPAHLAPYVKNVPAAIQLGKALFWDMQVGSDGKTACASCHYRAGADPVTGTGPAPKDLFKRNRNQLHPGPDAVFGNNSTVINTFDPNAPADPVTGLPVLKQLMALEFPWITTAKANYLLNTTIVNSTIPLGTQRDFPLFQLNPPLSRLVIDPLTGLTSDFVTELRDTNDAVGSQGVRLADFMAIVAGSAVDSGTPIADQIFHISSTLPNADPANNVRRVTKRNSPSVINAVFNYTNFWDGRANNHFNGVNPFGPLDQSAVVYRDNGGGTPLETMKIAIPNSSLASQATGPPLDHTEMSFNGRTFPELGRKMLSLVPLGLQHVHPDDSVLGAPLAKAGLGLNTDYTTMIKAAFQDNLTGNKTVNLPTIAVPGGEPFKQIEANFSLFWGLAIQLYEATLVSDRTPFDRFQLGNQNALSLNAQKGFSTFDSKCSVCHTGSELSSAVVGGNNCTPVMLPTDCNRVVFTNNTTHKLIVQDVNLEAGAAPAGLIDAGFFNIGVRPTTDDIGRGGNAPSGFPLSFTQLAKTAGLPFVTPKLPILIPNKINGSFKTPGLRNVELTAPYFHNGDALTLDQVVEFYSRGGNFPGNPELASAMQPIGNMRQDAVRRAEVVEFLMALTDERVRNEQAPFDHPELTIMNGVNAGVDDEIVLPATGGGPAPTPPVVFTMNPVITPTSLTTQVISGTVDDTATVAVSINGGSPAVAIVGAPAGAVTPVPANSWSFTVTGLIAGTANISVTATSITGGTAILSDTIQVLPTATISGTPFGGVTTLSSATLTIGGGGVTQYRFSLDNGAFSADTPVATPIVLSGLADGNHTVTVLGKDAGGNLQPALTPTTAAWTVKSKPPVLTLNPIAKSVKKSTLTIGGTVELGSVPTITVSPPVTASTATTIGGNGIATWSCDISGLVPGTNNIKVTALDFVFNQTQIADAITRVVPDGNMKGTGTVNISDALRALRIAAGIIAPTSDDLLRGDVAPLVNGTPDPDDIINVQDALAILKKAVGLVTSF